MKLFKYYPLNEYSIRALTIPGLWCHHPSSMNDPFECLGGFDFEYSDEEFSNFLERLAQVNSETASKLIRLGNEKLRTTLLDYRRKLIEKYAFCALSERFDNILMWSHYSNQHHGCVIGIEFPDDVSGHLVKVEYVDSPKPLPFDTLLTLFDSSNDGTDEGRIAIKQIHSHLSVKAACWEYECEWRLWRNRPCYYHYKQSQITDVIFGVRCGEEMKYAVSKLLDELPDSFMFKTMEAKYGPPRLEW